MLYIDEGAGLLGGYHGGQMNSNYEQQYLFHAGWFAVMKILYSLVLR
jgi:hypothetical protein